MPFVALNGIQARVVQAELMNRQLGDAVRMAGGGFRREVRAEKRAWRLRLRPLNPDDGHGLVQMLLGRGHGFPYLSSVNSAGGSVPVVDGGPSCLLAAADGAAISVGKFGGAVAVDEGTTNLLDSDVATATGQSGTTAAFGAVDGSTLNSVTTHVWQGSRSLEVITSAAVNGTRGGASATFTGAATTTYTGSMWIKAATAVTVRAAVHDVTNGINGTPITFSIQANVWTWIHGFTVTSGAGSPTIRIQVLEETADSGITFYVGALQVEAKDWSTAWVDGTRADGQLCYHYGLAKNIADLTFNAWITLPELTTADRRLISIRGAPTDLVLSWFQRWRLVCRGGGSGIIDFLTGETTVGGSDTISSGALSRDTLYMVTALTRRSPRAGQAKKELWINGALVASSSPTSTGRFTGLFDFETTDTRIGMACAEAGIAEWSGGAVSEAILVPYAASANQIAAWYASTRSLATFPKLVMSGDLLRSWETVDVKGTIDQVRYLSAFSGSTFYNNMREISCVLEEV